MNHTKKPTLRPYITGFVLSLVFTIGSYLIITLHLFSSMIALSFLMEFAVVQLIVQLVCFLHLGREQKPYLNVIFFISTLGVVLLVVVGSIWIMNHLNHNMTPQQMYQYVQSQDGL